MKTKLMVFGVIFFMLSVSHGGSFGFDKGNKMGPSGHRGEILRKLNLSEEQIEAVRVLRTEIGPKRKALRQDGRTIHEEMKAAMSGDADESTLKSIHERKKANRNASADLRFHRLLGIRKILNNDQRKEFLKHMGEKKRGHRRREY